MFMLQVVEDAATAQWKFINVQNVFFYSIYVITALPFFRNYIYCTKIESFILITNSIPNVGSGIIRMLMGR